MPKQARSEATRRALLEAAERLFASRGYLAVSVDEICRAAGVSKGAFYHHFASKQAVFLALLEAWLQRLQNVLEAERAATPALPEALQAMSRQLAPIWETGRAQWPLLLDFWSHAIRDPEVWQATVAPYRRFEALFAEWLAEAAAQGASLGTDPLTAARTLLAFATGVLLQGLLLPNDANWPQIAQEGVLTLLRGWGMLPSRPAAPQTRSFP